MSVYLGQARNGQLNVELRNQKQKTNQFEAWLLAQLGWHLFGDALATRKPPYLHLVHPKHMSTIYDNVCVWKRVYGTWPGRDPL